MRSEEPTEPKQPRYQAAGASPKHVMLTLAALVLVNLIVRYPYASQLVGADTFYVTGFAGSISELGRIGWADDALSYFGVPSGQPAAVPTLLSGTSQLSGLNIIASNYLITSLLSTLAALSSFCLAIRVRRNATFALAVAIVFSLSPRFVSLTINQASTRDLFLTMMPVFFLVLLEVMRKPERRWAWILLAECLALVMFATHRVAILLLPAVLALGLSFPFAKLLSNPRFPEWARVPSYILTFSFLFLVQVYGLLPRTLTLQNQYLSGRFFVGTEVWAIGANTVIDFASGVGVLAPLAVIGLVTVLRRPLIRPRELFSPLLFLILAPTIVLGFYVVLILLAPLSILIGMGLHTTLLRAGSSQARSAIALGLAALLTIGSSAMMLGIWKTEARELDSGSIMTGSYLRAIDIDTFVCNDPLACSYRIWTISHRPPLAWSNEPLVAYGVIPDDEIFDSRGAYSELQAGDFGSVSSQHLMNRFKIDVYVERREFHDEFRFHESLMDSAYVVFAIDTYIVWQL